MKLRSNLQHKILSKKKKHKIVLINLNDYSYDLKLNVIAFNAAS